MATILIIGRSLIRRIKERFIPLEKDINNSKNNFLTGFTFIELLLVVILLGVLVTISAPNLRNTYYNFLLSDTTHNLTYIMRYAQTRAIAERSNYRLNFNSERNRYWLTKKSEQEENQLVRIEGRFGKAFNIANNIKLESESDTINFYPDGRIDKINIYLSNDNEKFYTISTEVQTGYVQEFDYKR